mmetsp:Transcript_131702/g.421370  ORF Transcript_131702/g.421370 Transcript_131702/m.421370 type:complete len:236 (-) Transcript_131702:61-768(-)
MYGGITTRWRFGGSPHWNFLPHGRTKSVSRLNSVRENYNWEKHQMMLDYLNSPNGFSHVLVLDADAAFVQPDHDIMSKMASELELAGKELLLSNEDWLGDESSKGRINGGLLFAKNTNYTRALFEDMLDAHWSGKPGKPKPRSGGATIQGCAGNEQLCLGAVQNRKEFKAKVLVTSGMRYNCGAKEAFFKRMQAADSDLEIMHFMGGSKTAATRVLCKGPRDLTTEGPTGYGCAG